MKTTLLKFTNLLIIHPGCCMTVKQTRRRYQLMHHLIYVGRQVLLYIPTSILNDASIAKRSLYAKVNLLENTWIWSTLKTITSIHFNNEHRAFSMNHAIVIYVSISVIVWIQWALNANIIDGTFKIRLKWAVQIRSRHRRRNRYFFLVKHNKTIAIYLLLSVLVRSINSCYFEK